MNRKMFEEAMGEFAKYFNVSYHPKAVAELWQKVEHMPDGAMGRTGNRIFNEYVPQNRLPLSKIEAVIMEERAKIRDEEWNRQKGADSRGRVERPTVLSEDQRGEFAKGAVTVIRMILADMPADRIQQGLNHMAACYPGSGYPRLARSYELHGDFRDFLI